MDSLWEDKKSRNAQLANSMNEFSQVIEKNFAFLYKTLFLSYRDIGLKIGLASHWQKGRIVNKHPAPVTLNASSTRREAADCTSRLFWKLLGVALVRTEWLMSQLSQEIRAAFRWIPHSFELTLILNTENLEMCVLRRWDINWLYKFRFTLILELHTQCDFRRVT